MMWKVVVEGWNELSIALMVRTIYRFFVLVFFQNIWFLLSNFWEGVYEEYSSDEDGVYSLNSPLVDPVRFIQKSLGLLNYANK